MEIGTLKELNVKVGDVVEDTDDGMIFKIARIDGLGAYGKTTYNDGSVTEDDNWSMGGISSWRIVSRASEAPKLWGEMSDAEKGALLLDWSDNHGRNVQQWNGSEWVPMATGRFGRVTAYRVRPESVREVVKIFGSGNYWTKDKTARQSDTHRITFETVDGKPDCASIKMETIE